MAANHNVNTRNGLEQVEIFAHIKRPIVCFDRTAMTQHNHHIYRFLIA